MKTTTHDRFIVAAILIIMAVLLWILPAQAQCEPSCRDVPEPPITSTASTAIYLPAVARNWHAWYTDSELDAAMIASGYDVPTASMHTVCMLDPTAVPPYLIRYISCEQYWVNGVATEGTGHYIWYIRMSDGVVAGLEVNS